MRSLLSLMLLVALTPAAARADEATFTLRPGDRVVLLGNTLIEREQNYGWWEVALTARFHASKPTFRNLGWSGDTVFGDARAGFGGPADGFRELKKQVLDVKPTVLLVAYGTNESFQGPAGLANFTRGLNTLLDALAEAKARQTVLLGPMRQGDMGRPLPDPTRHNANLRLYGNAIRDVAKKRGLVFVDLYDLFGDVGKVRPAVSDNGVHFTGAGYAWSAPLLLKGLGVSRPADKAEVDYTGKPWKRTDEQLPTGPRTLVVKGLPAGKPYTLTIDGEKVATADAAGWAKGVTYSAGPDFAQREKLRRAIVAKNELFFHRWRPQNITYLTGFRKHEQGKNYSEVPKFDPLVEAKEKEIAKLATPEARVYAFIPAVGAK